MNAIITGVDKLIDLVNHRHEISVSAAAKQLNVSESIVEHWAESLEHEKQLVVKVTLNEKYLISIHSDDTSYSHLKTFLKQISTGKFYKSKEENLKLREKEIQKNLQLLKQRLNEMKKYDKMISDIDKKSLKLDEQRQELVSMKKSFDTEKSIFDKEKKNFTETFDKEKRTFLETFEKEKKEFKETCEKEKKAFAEGFDKEKRIFKENFEKEKKAHIAEFELERKEFEEKKKTVQKNIQGLMGYLEPFVINDKDDKNQAQIKDWE